MILRFFCLAALLTTLNLQAATASQTDAAMVPAETSVLATGNWYKIKIYTDGIYRLTYEDIISMGFTNPAGIRVFGNGGDMLPLMNDEVGYDDLVENPLFISKGADGIFNNGDYVLFYGKGPVSWNYNETSGLFEHRMNLFTKAAYYFVTTDGTGGKLITNAAEVTGMPVAEVTAFDDYTFHEISRYNFLKSGRQWFGERIDYTGYDTTIVFEGLTASPVKIKANVVSRSANMKTFIFEGNGEVIGSVQVPGVVLGNTTGQYANQKSAVLSMPVSSNQIDLSVTYNKSESADEGFLDYLIVNVRRNLSMTGHALFFRDRSVAGSADIARFTVENCNSYTQIWDITDRHNIRGIPAQLAGNRLTFSDSAVDLREYVAVNTNAPFPKPEISPTHIDLGPVENQDLHSTGPFQMLIITHPLFLAAADSIAEFHRQKDHLSVFVASTEKIYNEFSSGAPDVSAIRNFAKMVYDRSTSGDNKLQYLLLLGDGSYNNLSQATGNSNFILTYQSESSLNASTSYVSDDFFGFMDDHEGGSEGMEYYLLDLGVGRLPVKTAEEAMALYRKIKNYNTGANSRDWRNNILFAGDDEDGNLHMTQANSLADWVSENHPSFVVKKVMLDAYKQVSSSAGARYPDVNRILSDNMHKGLLIFNYTGHGGEIGLASEHILMREDLIGYTNSANLPLFVTATCEFSRFDDLTDDEGVLTENTSAGEASLLNPNGGSIALFTTTRIVYSDRNHYLNTKFYRVVFQRDQAGNFYRLGDVVRMTKDSSGINRNKLNFILLGDPALTLAIPNYSIVTDSLNGKSVLEPLDTLMAFSRIRISGHLEDDNQVMTGFNGTIYPSVFDKSQQVTTLANDGGESMQFGARENLVYKGKASIRNGYFSFDFVVPKDITYSYGNGKLVYYAQDTIEDANGFFSDFIIGGTSPDAASDNAGPVISLYLNDEYFSNEGITNTDPVIYALISDESGINMVGNGIGHDITGVIDGNVTEPVVLNQFFEADLDDYTSGSLKYPMNDLAEGWHSLEVKVWDVFNNSSEATIQFRVITDNKVIIANASNYPNPAGDQTSFIFEHNKPGEELRVTISIFDMSGRNVATLDEMITTAGFSSTPLEWNLKDQQGNSLREGIYPYRIRVMDINGSYADSYQKLVVIRQ